MYSSSGRQVEVNLEDDPQKKYQNEQFRKIAYAALLRGEAKWKARLQSERAQEPSFDSKAGIP